MRRCIVFCGPWRYGWAYSRLRKVEGAISCESSSGWCWRLVVLAELGSTDITVPRRVELSAEM